MKNNKGTAEPTHVSNLSAHLIFATRIVFINKFSRLYVTHFVCGTVSSMLSGLKTRSLGLNTLGTTK